MAENGFVKIPMPIWDEIERVYSPLSEWQKEHKDAFVYQDGDADALVGEVLDLYAPDLSEDEIYKIGADPFLIAYARHKNAKLVTKEASKPTRQRANRHIPDICNEFGVEWITDHQLIIDLDFKI